jgi:hypothetical protein
LIGLPGSGKSTFFRQHFAGTHDHVSKDAMPTTRQPERRQAQLLAESLGAGRSVVVDNTNPAVALRAGVIAAARRHGAEIAATSFPPRRAIRFAETARERERIVFPRSPFSRRASVSNCRHTARGSTGCTW